MQRIVGTILVLFFSWISVVQAEEQPVVTDLSAIKVLDLKTAQTLALAGNPDMSAALARIEQARARVQQAVAAWWPSLDVSASAVRQRLSDRAYEKNRFLAQQSGVSVDQSESVYQSGVEATWLLFDGFYRTFKEEQARYDEQATGADMTDSQRLLVAATAEAFLNAQLAQTFIDISRADETFYIQQLEDAQNRFKIGAGPWGDVLNIRVQVNSAKNSLIQSQREFEAAGYGLAALLGLPDAAFPSHLRLAVLDQNAVTPTVTKSPEVLIEEALTRRPDIRRLEMVVKQAEASMGMSRAPLYPKVRLAGSVQGAREGSAGLSSQDFGSTVGMNMSWNLYAGGADKARMIEAEEAKREAVYTLAGLRNAVASEIRQDLAMLAAAEEQLLLQRETVKLVEENRDLAKNEYEAGESPLIWLNEAQRDLVATHSRLAQALVACQLAEQRLLAATGRNLDGLPQSGDKGR
ncbi:MAG: TolC family protein [Desulfobulbus sp.]|nr:TolC family protein [Desulfobulbus sp.]